MEKTNTKRLLIGGVAKMTENNPITEKPKEEKKRRLRLGRDPFVEFEE